MELRQRKTKWERENRQKLHSQGLCIKCKNPSEQWFCQSCRESIYKQRIIRRRKEDYKRKNKEWRTHRVLELKKEIYSLLGDKCSQCGFSDFRAFQIDHVKGNGHEERKKHTTNLTRYKLILEAIKNGSKDYQLLCANCNWIKMFEKREFKK